LPRDVRVIKGGIGGLVSLEENGATFFVDVLEGQKTGWFFDQRDNRAFMAGLSQGARVIDLYSYNGGFAVQAAKAGAESVIAVDRSADALAKGAEAAKANGVAGICQFHRAEAFEDLERRAG